MTNDKGILIRNIYYMLSYAFLELKRNNYEDIAKEEFEHILDLFAEILYRGVSDQLKHGLYREYIDKHETLSTLRGRLDINGTIRNILQHKRNLDCVYDELSENNHFNRIIKSTMLLLIHNKDVKSKRKKELRTILPFFSNVSEVNLREIRWSTLRFQRSNQSYLMLINMCHFIVDGMLLTTDNGNVRMATFSDEHMNKLFERFVLNYYKREYPSLNANADNIKWNVDDEDSIGLDLLPSMQSDITLHYGSQILIIDTKYYGKMMQTKYEKHTIHSANMYQIFTYVKNRDQEHSGKVSGILLYARTEEKIAPELDTYIDGNRIMVNTINLNQEFKLIASELDEIIDKNFNFISNFRP